ncbi:hypothetical protein [Streptomyces sp. WZ.A104]|uniref:hypothetical protein n=1 Tax=Streptomyces sp. WZ.A104 TaxID=2023771 RepID=UPI00117BE9AB|nr:hypothetical protein [Streptomyces sp. WZ.A104]
MRAASLRPAGFAAAGPGAASPSYGGCPGPQEITIGDLFPLRVADEPFAAVIGEHFDTLTIPRRAALEVISRFEGFRPHPVGAAVARACTDEWVLILPPGSGYGMQWSWPAEHRDEGLLEVPPRAAGPGDDLRWARFGNAQGRVFSAPFLLMAALCPPPATRPPYFVPARDDRTPVGI